MPRRSPIAAAAAALVVLALATTYAAPLRADAHDAALPPWTDPGDVPLPAWARSVAPTKMESAIYVEPGKLDQRRGSAQPGARLPLFATRRASGCMGRWLNVGPHAWMCSDVAELSADAPVSPKLGTRPWSTLGATTKDPARPRRAGATVALPPIEPVSSTDDGLPYRYFFAGRDGAFGFMNLGSALDDAPDQELEPGFAVAIVEERVAHGERWGKTKKDRWIALRELVSARPNLFHGELVPAPEAGQRAFGLEVAWVISARAPVYASERAGKATGARARFDKVRVLEERGAVVRVASEGDPPAWMRAKDLARPRLSAPPPEVRADVDERWLDVDLASQTLVAYVGARPVFATIVSTGKGAPGSATATRKGTFRVWAKIFTTKMDNLDEDTVDRRYAIEDVPWVQFFDEAIALHGAFWHREFGRVRSHGCVNLAPLDARWLFAFTSPHVPAGWTAALPTKAERGAVIRVR